jgi:hypothetical protein
MFIVTGRQQPRQGQIKEQRQPEEEQECFRLQSSDRHLSRRQDNDELPQQLGEK